MKQKHTKYTQIDRNKSTQSEMGPVWQNPIQSEHGAVGSAIYRRCSNNAV